MSVPIPTTARSNSYFEGGYLLDFAGTAISIIVAGLLLVLGWARGVRTWLEQKLKWFPLVAFGSSLFYILVSSVLTFPFSWYVGFVRQHEYNLSTQTFGEWFNEQLIGLAIGVVIGSIYAGWATPTESAAIGVAMAAIIAMLGDGLPRSAVVQALEGTIRISAMIMLVIVGAYFLNFAMTSAGLGRQLSALIGGSGLSPFGTLMLVIALYIVLGFFIETLALMVATIPIVVPIMAGLGYDKVWFGILLIVLIEMALITPPVGLNLFVVQGARKRGSINDVIMGVIPYVLVMVLMVVALIALPGLALWLPSAF